MKKFLPTKYKHLLLLSLYGVNGGFSLHSPVKDSGLLEDVAEVDVGVQEVGVQRDGLLEVVDGQPDFLTVGGSRVMI